MKQKRLKKKLKLRKQSKLCLTMFIICLMPFIYKSLGILGSFIKTSSLAEVLVIIGWFWLIIGQTLFLSFLWED